VVEGVFAALHCVQNGLRATVATLGSALSDEQAALLLATKRPVVLMFDGDESGQVGMDAALPKLVSNTFVRIVHLGGGRQPDHLNAEELKSVLAFAR
jgi:DNA primase